MQICNQYNLMRGGRRDIIRALDYHIEDLSFVARVGQA